MKTLIALALVVLAGTVAAVAAQASTAASTELSPAEITELRYMREEEKLARDVYRALAVKWSDATVFARIAQSEQRHMEAVKAVMDRYGVADPAAGKAAGSFTDARLQALYDDLLADGSRSLQTALAVGVTIEKTDIADLEDALEATSNADLERLYGNLLRASQHHLQAFTATTTGTVPSGGRAHAGQANGTCPNGGRDTMRQGAGSRGGNGYGAGLQAAAAA